MSDAADPAPGAPTEVWTWDTWAKPADTPAKDFLTETAERLLRLKDEKAQLTTMIEEAEATLAAAFPEDEGAFSHQFGAAVVTVKRAHSWEWDQGALEKKFAGVPLPDFLKVKYTIPKKDFAKLPPEEQAELRDALVSKLKAPTVTVAPAHKVAK